MDNTHAQTAQGLAEQIKATPATALEVITNPAGFFRQMPKTGGFLAPLLFMVVMGAIGGVLQAILGLFGLGSGDMISGLIALILMPIMVAIFSFVGAAILFVFWKILGSAESYETAFRCGAYTAAIMPITILLNIIPYLGTILGLAWMTFLLVQASMEVHGMASKKAWTAFGILFAFLAISSISTEIASRKISKSMAAWQQNNGDHLEEMTPEEAGKAMGEFLKAFGKTAEQE